MQSKGYTIAECGVVYMFRAFQESALSRDSQKLQRRPEHARTHTRWMQSSPNPNPGRRCHFFHAHSSPGRRCHFYRGPLGHGRNGSADLGQGQGSRNPQKVQRFLQKAQIPKKHGTYILNNYVVLYMLDKCFCAQRYYQGVGYYCPSSRPNQQYC